LAVRRVAEGSLRSPKSRYRCALNQRTASSLSDLVDGIPGPVSGLDIRSLPLTAVEGFVLSRVDGRTGLADIVALTGLGEAQVTAILTRLAELGAITWLRRSMTSMAAPRLSEPASARPNERAVHERTFARASFAPMSWDGSAPRRTMSPAAESSGPTATSETEARAPLEPATSTALPSVPPLPSLYDPAELDEEIDLPRDRRVQVLERFYRLGHIDHYALLGVAGDADKKSIKSAYFALSKAFHPDSMFRKNLGSYKSKMVSVFQALTDAHETLTKSKSRAEYDAYLAATRTTARAERAMALPPFGPLPESDRRQMPDPPRVAPAPEPPTPPTAEASPRDAAVAAAAPARPASDDARRLAQAVIAKRIRGATRPAIPTPDGPGPAPSGQVPKPFDDAPKTDARQLLSRLTRTLKDVGQLTGGDDRVTRAVRLSQAALDRGDLSEATQQIARAAVLAPERPDLRKEHHALSGRLAQSLADTWAQQATFEEKHGKWAFAAVTWAKVCEGRPDDALAHRSAANALLKAGGDLRGAQKYAQKAALLAPRDIHARVLLAQIYLTAGLKLNARRELEAATKLDPANEMVKNLLAELKG
jgi:tetratricopeptide (TPR) repeat protein